MRKNKMGAMFVVSVLALAGIGISYAGWTDTISISGTVSTGDVDLNIVFYTGTWVWKHYLDVNGDPLHDVIIQRGRVSLEDLNDDFVFNDDPNGYYDDEDHYELVAYAYSAQATNAAAVIDDSFTMKWVNLFPCIDFVADVVLHYDGSIPARVQDLGLPVLDSDAQAWMPPLIGMYSDIPTPHIYVVAYRCDLNGNPIGADGNVIEPKDPPYDGYQIVSVGTQLHFCDYIKLELHMHIPQTWPGGAVTTDLMNRWGNFTANIGVIQFNEL